MDTAARMLHQLKGAENIVSTAYYRVAADYHKVCPSINVASPTPSDTLAGKGDYAP